MLKRYHAGVSDIPVELEYQASLMAWRFGLPVARPLGLMQAQGRPAILFERVEGPTMLSVMQRQPLRMWPLVRALARYQAGVHQHRAVSDIIPTMREVLIHRIMRSAAGKRPIDAAMVQIDALPDGDRLCHGDLHPDNMLMRDGAPVAIDWSKAAIGPPAADAARTAMLIQFGHGGRGGSRGMQIAQAITAQWYRFNYARMSGVAAAQLRAWQLPIAVAWYRGQRQLNAAGLPAWIAARTGR